MMTADFGGSSSNSTKYTTGFGSVGAVFDPNAANQGFENVLRPGGFGFSQGSNSSNKSTRYMGGYGGFDPNASNVGFGGGSFGMGSTGTSGGSGYMSASDPNKVNQITIQNPFDRGDNVTSSGDMTKYLLGIVSRNGFGQSSAYSSSCMSAFSPDSVNVAPYDPNKYNQVHVHFDPLDMLNKGPGIDKDTFVAAASAFDPYKINSSNRQQLFSPIAILSANSGIDSKVLLNLKFDPYAATEGSTSTNASTSSTGAKQSGEQNSVSSPQIPAGFDVVALMAKLTSVFRGATGGSSSSGSYSSGSSTGVTSSGGSTSGGSSSGGSLSGSGSSSGALQQNLQPPSFLLNPSQFLSGGGAGGSGSSSAGTSNGGSSGGGSSSGGRSSSGASSSGSSPSSGTSSTGGSSGGSQMPSYDPNKVNMINANFMDPSSFKLGQGGSASGGFDPDAFNSQSFSFFNPSAFTGKRRRQTALRIKRQSQTGDSGGQAPSFDPNSVNQLTANMLDPTKQQLGANNGAGSVNGASFDPDQFNTMQFNFFNPQAQSGGGGGSGGNSSGGGSAPTFDANNVNQVQTNFLDPSQSKLGQSGGGGGGGSTGSFDPDKYNSMSFNFFNPQAQAAAIICHHT
ncbi:uncharacterized transmembrane protein DDB_G0289901-like, partial [Mercenaria mercenaria]|uniref:uncharacterized transmembrane protein DDB_G0289901-like n=1 Tax=Mercenaria mercenaria TaxID=6596 RepID=UPI00234EED2B